MDRLKPWILGVLDILSVIAAYFFALLLRFDFRYSAVDKAYLMGYFHTIPIWCVATVVVFYIFIMRSQTGSGKAMGEKLGRNVSEMTGGLLGKKPKDKNG